MKKMRWLAILLVVVMTFGLAACGGGGGAKPADGGAKEEAIISADDSTKDYSGRTLKLLLSIGGGGNYYEPIAKRMMEAYPGLKVEIQYSNTAEDDLRTLILAGNAPDIFNVNAGKLPWYNAIEQDLARPIDDIFKVPTMDGSKTLGDLLDKGMFSLGEYEGHYYVMHEFQYLNGFWYDKAWFEQNNLQVPTDWASLQKLADDSKAAGSTLLGYMGIAADEYGVIYWLYPMIASTDYDTFVKMANLDPEVWKSDAMRKVVDKMVYVRDGNYDINTLGCGATEAQIAFIDHDFAIYPCGSWLEAEMEGAWTEGWDLEFLPYTFGDSADQVYMVSGGLASMVYKDTPNWDLVQEFYRFMFSDDQSIVESTKVHHNVMLIPQFSELCGDIIDPSVLTAYEAMKNMKTINQAMFKWYPDTATELGNMMNALMGGDIDADEFLQRGYDYWTKLKNDDKVTKYTFTG